jgi:hypothetical protein
MVNFIIKNPENKQMNYNDLTYDEENCEMDLSTTIVVVILILSIIYYLMNLFGKKIGNTRTNWLVIIALVASAIYLLTNNKF